MTVLDEIGRAQYVSLTTYRKNGTGVPTPVWAAIDGNELITVSDADAWKVKRIRNNSRVVVTVCGFRGRIAPGAPTAEGTARLLDEDGTRAARELLARKYVLARIGRWAVKTLRVRERAGIGIAVVLEPAG